MNDDKTQQRGAQRALVSDSIEFHAFVVWGLSMGRRMAHMITYTITGGRLSESELQYYLNRAAEQHPGTDHIDIDIDGDFVNVAYFVRPFERIRRITGYLVGTLDRFNDAKRAEVGDRVKHGFDITDDDRFNDWF